MADKKEPAKQQPPKQGGCCKPGKPCDTSKPTDKKDAPRPKR